MPLYEVIVTTPFDYDYDNRSVNHTNLLYELEPLGLTNAEMRPFGYIFEFLSDLDERNFENQVEEIIDYYGLAIRSIDDVGF